MKFKIPFFKQINAPNIIATGRECELIAKSVRLTEALMRTRKDRDQWKAKFEEMEQRWLQAKQRKDELRKEKNELEATISDLLNRVQEQERSVANTPNSSNAA